MDSSEAKKPVKILIFIGVGIILLALILFGVVWAKNQADKYANKPNETTKQQPPAPEPSHQAETPQNSGGVAGSQTNPASAPAVSPTPSSSSIPAAGPEDTFVVTVSLTLITFFVVRALQARRRATL